MTTHNHQFLNGDRSTPITPSFLHEEIAPNTHHAQTQRLDLPLSLHPPQSSQQAASTHLQESEFQLRIQNTTARTIPVKAETAFRPLEVALLVALALEGGGEGDGDNRGKCKLWKKVSNLK